MVLYNFSAVKLPGEAREWLYAGAYLRSDYDYSVLKEEHKISHIINLTHEILVPDDIKDSFSFTRIPVEDYTPPTLAQIEQFVDTLKAVRDAGGRAYVHCHAGMGRTGTMLACWVVANNAARTASDAVAWIRKIRPGSIDTDKQAEVVSLFASSRTNKH